MKRVLFTSLVMLTACANMKKKAEFIPHTEEKPMKAYLAMNLPYPSYRSLVEQVEEIEGVALTTRGEAHITVVTPIEYDKILKKHLSIAEIHKIAEEAKIQETEFTQVCIGRGQKEIQGKLEKTYFVVVESPPLIELRARIEKAYVKNGGRPQEFIPEKFLPHVTLGFTSRDLHYEDGIVKDKTSCLYPLESKTESKNQL